MSIEKRSDIAELERRGHDIAVTPRRFGNMNVVTWDRATGQVEAATDPRGAVEAENVRVY